jgi:heme-degrading monooxygenase HmoA
MISRHWTAVAKPGQAEAYRRHLVNDTFPQLANIPGFLRASVLSRSVPGGTEFRVVTEWESLEAIRAFAGSSVEAAVVPPLVQELMARYDSVVVHYEVQEQYDARTKE